MLFVRPVARPTLAPLSGANHVLDIIRSVPTSPAERTAMQGRGFDGPKTTHNGTSGASQIMPLYMYLCDKVDQQAISRPKECRRLELVSL